MSEGTGGVLESIAGKYELLRKLGQGGMGAVYLVRHRLLDQLRVVKVMHSQLGADGDFEQRFRQEAKVAAQLRHPHIATLHDFDVTPGGSAYILSEYVRGATLETMLRSGPLPVELAVRIAFDCLGALDYLHRAGFIHRDISPDNLIVDLEHHGGPSAVLIDLGIAKRLGGEQGLTQAGAFLGKVTYGSPEQLGSAAPAATSDLYSLGIVLYQALTGRLPFEGETVAAMIGGHLYRPPLPFETTDPHGRVPEAVRRVVLRALEKDPLQRFASAEEMARALQLAMPALLSPGDAAELATVPDHGRSPAPAVSLALEPTARLRAATTLAGAAPGGTTELAPAPLAPSPGRRFVALAMGGAGLIVAVAVVVAVLSIRGGEHELPAPHATATVAAPAATAEATMQLPASFRLGKGHALVIGNNDYQSHGQGLQSLTSAVPDAEAVAEVLERRFGYQVDLRRNASRDEIVEALQGLSALQPEDYLLIYYAGHGDMENGRGYWLPVDAEGDSTANWIPNREIHEMLLDVHARHILLIADSCFAGSLGSGSDRAEVDPAVLFDAPAALVLTSGALQPVEDRGTGPHSLFTNAFLAQLRGSPGPFTSEQLYHRVSRALQGIQEPQWKALFGHQGGDFILVPRPGS